MTNNSRPFVSIVLCTHNGEKKISEALNSLIQLEYPKELYEVIVIDDGSTDNTAAIVRKYPFDFYQLTDNKGLSAARNYGLYRAKGEIYVCFDDDCVCEKDWLENLIGLYKFKNVIGVGGFIKESKHNSIIDSYVYEIGYGNPSRVNTSGSLNFISRFINYVINMIRPIGTSKSEVIEVNEIYGLNSSFLISALKEIGGWDEELSGAEDMDLCQRIHKRYPEKLFLVHKKAKIIHNHKSSFVNFINRPLIRANAIYAYYAKHSKFPPIFPYPFLIIAICLFFGRYNPIYLVLTFVLVCQIFYFWWLINFLAKRNARYLIFPYIQFSVELMSIIGLFKGIITWYFSKKIA